MIKNVFLALVSLFIFASCSKNNDPIPTPTPNPILNPIAKSETHYISFTTKTAKGQKIELKINAAEADRAGVWIDLNGNGIKDRNEEVKQFDVLVEYEVDSKFVVVYGKVSKFDCNDNSITDLDVSKNDSLLSLLCMKNELSTLDVSQNTKLQALYCANNSLRSLDLKNNINLLQLNCSINPLKTIDISKNINLQTIICFSNELTALDLTNNSALQFIDCSSNKLTELDVKDKAYLWWLIINNNQIKDADKMQAIVDALPHRQVNDNAQLTVVETQTSKENKISQAQVKALYGKRWLVNDSSYKDYAGE